MDKNYRERRNTENTITNFLNGKHITKDSFYMEQLVESLKNIFGDSFREKAENYLEAIKRYIESETQLKVYYTADVEDDYITINAEKGNWHYRRNMHFGEFNLIVRKYEAELFASDIICEMREAYVSDTFLRRKNND